MGRGGSGSTGWRAAGPPLPSLAGAVWVAVRIGWSQAVSQTSNTGCSTALRPGLSANTQPVKIRASLAVELDLVDLDEGGGLGRLGGRARVADARRDLQRAEAHGLVELDLELGDAPRDLVEGGEHGDLILLALGEGRGGDRHRRETRKRDQLRAAHHVSTPGMLAQLIEHQVVTRMARWATGTG